MKTGKTFTLLAGIVIGMLLSAGLFLSGDKLPFIQKLTGHKHDGFTTQKEEKEQRYQCPMHPTYISDEPGDCPICGMKLIPIEEEEEEEGMEEELPEGLATIKIDPERRQIIGIRTSMVEMMPLTKDIRTIGVVKEDERKVAHIHTKFSGWVSRLHVDYTGRKVRRGQPLLSVYSPELVSSQEEYLLALEAREKFSSSSIPDVVRGGDDLVDASRRRLRLFDIPASTIRNIEKTGRVRKNMTIYSPISGYVTRKMANKGMYVEPKMELYTITDYSVVWVLADLYEYELQHVKVGDMATMDLSYYPGETFTGKVTYIYPYLEEKTRTIKARFEFENKDERLKPGMYVNINIKVPLGKLLAVTKEAVIDTGERKIVFVDLGDGRIQPREVKLGTEAKGYVEVLEGLEEGEKVIASAQFLIDSESRLKAAISGMTGQHQH